MASKMAKAPDAKTATDVKKIGKTTSGKKTTENQTAEKTAENKTVGNKKTETQAAEKKTVVKRTTRKKPAAEKNTEKKAETRTRTKKTTELFIQFSGYEVSQEDLVARAKEAWAQSGNKISDIITLSLYVKPEEYKAYYVINGSFAGALDL